MALQYKAVVFDLDGTLTRSGEGIMRSAAYALEKIGARVPDESTLLKFIGPPLVHSFMELIHLSEQEALRAQTFYRERYNETGLFENEVYTGIPRILTRLKNAGAYLAVATGKPQGPTERILKHFGLFDLFDEVVGIGEKVLTADKKQLIQTALNGFSGRAVMVGDRRFDIEGAQAAGIDSIGVSYGYGSEEELLAAGAGKIVLDVTALENMLLGDCPKPRGVFLTVEGLDGSGKTTQVDALEKNLRRFGYDVRRTREPGGCPISEKIRHIVLDNANTGMSDMTEALLYAAARAQHVYEVIRPAVSAGQLVLCDRFVDSSITYQGGGRELGVDTVSKINAYAVGGLYPDATVYLDIGHKEALKRRVAATGADRIEMEAEAFHGRVEAAYQTLIARDQHRYLVVDARGDKESITQNCITKVIQRLRQIERADRA